MKCFFCGEADESALEHHHIIPKSLREGLVIRPSDVTVALCANCHKKLHSLIDPFKNYLMLVKQEERKEPEDKDSTLMAIYRYLQHPVSVSEVMKEFDLGDDALIRELLMGGFIVEERSFLYAIDPPPIVAFGDLVYGSDWMSKHWYGKFLLRI